MFYWVGIKLLKKNKWQFFGKDKNWGEKKGYMLFFWVVCFGGNFCMGENNSVVGLLKIPLNYTYTNTHTYIYT